ncbi:MAG: TetR family transcriptional regulator [Pirellulales bacterium]|nr:TetR family transcriptional regulator [Pirellulales bacterium]
MKTPTRQRLAEAALRRFYREGFRNVGIDQVLGEVGISKTAFYKHYESKEELMLAGLEFQHRQLAEMFAALVVERGGNDPAAQLRALVDVVEQLVESDDFHGCVFVNAAIEFPLPHDPTHVAAAESKQAIENFVADLARQAGARDPRLLARELCLIMEGCYVTRHVSGKRCVVDVARRVADLVIDASLSGTAPTE